MVLIAGLVVSFDKWVSLFVPAYRPALAYFGSTVVTGGHVVAYHEVIIVAAAESAAVALVLQAINKGAPPLFPHHGSSCNWSRLPKQSLPGRRPYRSREHLAERRVVSPEPGDLLEAQRTPRRAAVRTRLLGWKDADALLKNELCDALPCCCAGGYLVRPEVVQGFRHLKLWFVLALCCRTCCCCWSVKTQHPANQQGRRRQDQQQQGYSPRSR